MTADDDDGDQHVVIEDDDLEDVPTGIRGRVAKAAADPRISDAALGRLVRRLIRIEEDEYAAALTAVVEAHSPPAPTSPANVIDLFGWLEEHVEESIRARKTVDAAFPAPREEGAAVELVDLKYQWVREEHYDPGPRRTRHGDVDRPSMASRVGWRPWENKVAWHLATGLVEETPTVRMGRTVCGRTFDVDLQFRLDETEPYQRTVLRPDEPAEACGMCRRLDRRRTAPNG